LTLAGFYQRSNGDLTPDLTLTKGGGQIDTKHIVSCLERYLPRFKIPVSFYELPDEAAKDRIKPDRHFLAKLAKELRKT